MAAATMTLTVDQLVSFIKSSVQKHYPDKEVAEYLKHVTLTNKLEDRHRRGPAGTGCGS